MKKWSVWVASNIVVVLVAATAAHAQFTFTPRVSVTEEYNDNINLDRKNKMDDWITTVSPGATLEWYGQAAGMRLSYDPSYSFYADHDEYDGWSHNASGTVWYNFSRATRLEVSNYFIYTKDPLSDDTYDSGDNLVVQGNNRSRGQNNKYYTDQASARLSHQFGPENTAYAQMAGGFTKYDDPGNSNTNGNTNDIVNEDGQWFTPSAGLTYWFSHNNGIETDFSYTRGLYEDDGQSDFNNYDGRLRFNHRLTQQTGVFAQYRQIYRTWDDPSDTTTNGQVEQDYFVYAPSVGVFHQFDPTLTASFGVGYFYQQVKDGNDESGPFISSELNKLWDFQRWSIRLRTASGIDSQDFTGDQQGLERFALVDVVPRYNFTRDFYGDLRLGVRYSDYLNSEDNEKDYRYTAEVGLGYAITRWAAVRVAYAFNKLDAINSTDDYEQNRAFVTLTLSPDQPWRIFD
jgi:hypothetical protein